MQDTPVITNPGGEIVLGTAVIPKPAYPKQQAPPPVLFALAAAQPAPYYYAQPQGFRPGENDPALAAPIAVGTPIGEVEVTADFVNRDLISTAQGVYNGDGARVTHANFFWNSLTQIERLERFPNLIRLTLRGNDLRSLRGVGSCLQLRWLDGTRVPQSGRAYSSSAWPARALTLAPRDRARHPLPIAHSRPVSVNNLEDLTGLENVNSLQWLSAHDNDLRTLDGLGDVKPGLQWLTVRNCKLVSLHGLRSLPGLRSLDASRNELGTTNGVGNCPLLLELNVRVNNLTDLAQIEMLPELRALDASSNELDIVPLALGRGLPHLHTLRLAHNNLTGRNAPELASAFRGHGALRSLALGRNTWSGDEVQALRNAFDAIGCTLDFSARQTDPDGDGSAQGPGGECVPGCLVS